MIIVAKSERLNLLINNGSRLELCVIDKHQTIFPWNLHLCVMSMNLTFKDEQKSA